jgi:phosphotransferase system HPr-like phosphotransfer protein
MLEAADVLQSDAHMGNTLILRAKGEDAEQMLATLTNRV